jgi:aminopeptidase N
MPRVSRTRHGETTLHWFAPTPPMPSYLVSVAVGHFERLEGRAAGVPVALLVAEGKREQARFALKVVQQVLPHYARYFGVPYALPKLDLMAVPSVRWGAMEDWGLISYAENNVLVDPARSSPQTTRDAWATIAHEVAHQWFGNLVTAASWEEIWLNEAFATWLQDKTTDHFNPAWKVRLLARRPLDRAMALDAGAATRAIRSGPVRETAVTDVFDHITYGKGGAVLGMLEQWLGPDRFRRGLVAYMKSQRLSNATAGDLWFHIGRASGLDVAGVAASWTDQQGFPLVRASRRCESGRQTLELAQSRFRSDDTAAASAQLWKIPLRLAFGGSERTVLLDTPTRRVELGPCGDTPVLVNAGGIGFYRVAYDAETLQGLTRRFVALADVDRITLLSDSFARVQSGDLPLAAYFALLERLPDVADASRTMLWSTAKSQLEFLDTTLSGGPAQQRLRALGRALLAPQLERLGWAGGGVFAGATAEWRGTLISLLAQFDHAPTIAQATRAFDDDDAGRRTLPASLREPVVVATGMHADRAHFDRLRARLAAASGEEERWLFVRALASGRDAAQADELLAASIAGIWPANIASSMAGMIARLSPTLGEQAYRFSVENWKPLAEQAGTWGRNFVLPGAAEGFHDSDTASRLVADQRRLVGADGDALAAQEADNIRLRSAVRRREAPALEKALAD